MKRVLLGLLFAFLLYALPACTVSEKQATGESTRKNVADITPAFDGSGLAWQETPRSTCFAYIGYDSDFEKLAVIFRSNESRAYIYADFTAHDMSEFLSAPSLGKYYNQNIKGQYASERIDDAEALMSAGNMK